MNTYTAMKVITVFSIVSSVAPVSAKTVISPELPSFDSVSLSGLGIVHIHKGPRRVTLTGNESDLNRFETTVQNGCLNMGYRQAFCMNPFRGCKPIDIDISMPELRSVTIDGNGVIKTDAFDFDSFTVEIKGNADMETAGTARSLILRCTGNVRYSGFALSAQNADVKVNGNAAVEISAEQKITASVNGSGSIVYRGDPTVEKTIRGSGTIGKAGDRDGEHQ
jgi:Protein of unknown function (DUF2807).